MDSCCAKMLLLDTQKHSLSLISFYIPKWMRPPSGGTTEMQQPSVMKRSIIYVDGVVETLMIILLVEACNVCLM